MNYDLTLRPDYCDIAREAKSETRPRRPQRVEAFVLKTSLMADNPRPAPAQGVLDRDGKYTMTVTDYNQYRRGDTRALYKNIRTQRATLRRAIRTIKLLSPKATWVETVDLAEIETTA